MRDTIDMAREVKMPYDFVTGEPINIEKLKAFEELVRSDEREQIIATQPAPVQEPVAWWNGEYGSPVFGFKRDTPGIGLGNPDATPLYTTPPAAQRQWVGLTAGERDALFTKHYQWDDYGKAIEAKLKEKNT